MTKATVAENVPHLCYREGRWTVRVKTARGDFTHLTEPTQYKSLAQRDLKNVRAEMVEMFLEKLRRMTTTTHRDSHEQNTQKK